MMRLDQSKIHKVFEHKEKLQRFKIQSKKAPIEGFYRIL